MSKVRGGGGLGGGLGGGHNGGMWWCDGGGGGGLGGGHSGGMWWCDGGGGGGGGGGGWSPSLLFLEQPLEREETPFFLQMMARVCGGVPSPLIEPIVGRERKGPT